jgi:proline iminopeptidase
MTVAVKGGELFYTTRGEGYPCLVLCSQGTEPQERQTPSALSDRLRLAYVDLRGGGRSTGRAADLTFDLLAEDLEAVRADLGAERIAVIGHSILGMLAIEYGRRCPAGVSHVITVGTPPTGDMNLLAERSAAFFAADATPERKQVLGENLARLPPGASMRQHLLAETPARFFDPRFDAAPLYEGADPKPRLIQHIMGTLANGWDVTVDASSLRVPVFIAQGRHDYVSPYTLWDGIADRLPDATVEVFERSGHQPFFEEPERFATALTDWMAGARDGRIAD